MSFYVCHGHSGMVVTSMEPEPGRYMAGPFPDHLDAFDYLQSAERKQSVRRAAFHAIWPLVLIGVVGVVMG